MNRFELVSGKSKYKERYNMPKTKPFDEYWKEYEEWFAEHHHVYLTEVDAIRHFIPRDGKGIEIGIGTGRFAIPFGIKEGIEPSRAMKKFAEHKGLKVYDGVAEELPLSDHSYDFALMVTTICFVDDILKSFYEVYRILNREGFIIVGLVDKNSPLGKEYEKIKDQNKFYREALFYSTDEVLDYLRKARFKIVEIIQTVFGELNTVAEIQPFIEGYGEGGFVVIKAKKLV
jgi:ubiquinone/menaquinone biosynthesis C-methylase UbiE